MKKSIIRSSIALVLALPVIGIYAYAQSSDSTTTSQGALTPEEAAIAALYNKLVAATTTEAQTQAINAALANGVSVTTIASVSAAANISIETVTAAVRSSAQAKAQAIPCATSSEQAKVQAIPCATPESIQAAIAAAVAVAQTAFAAPVASVTQVVNDTKAANVIAANTQATAAGNTPSANPVTPPQQRVAPGQTIAVSTPSEKAVSNAN